MKDEAFAALLTVGDDVDAERLLLAQCHDGGVVLRLSQRVTLKVEGGAAAVGYGKPGRTREAADAGGGERFEIHRRRSPWFACAMRQHAMHMRICSNDHAHGRRNERGAIGGTPNEQTEGGGRRHSTVESADRRLGHAQSHARQDMRPDSPVSSEGHLLPAYLSGAMMLGTLGVISEPLPELKSCGLLAPGRVWSCRL